MNHTTLELEPPRKDGRGIAAVENCDNPCSRNGSVDEDSTLNQSRRVGSDAQVVQAAILKCKKQIKISSFNARTLREEWRLEELVSCMEKNNISIIGIQEHRRVHDDEELKFTKHSKYHLITSSAWRNNAQAATGGVGILLNNKAENALCEVVTISPRVMKATFVGNPETTIIVAYSPTNVQSTDSETEKFYDDLRKAIESTPQHHFLTILGDMNAKVSASYVQFGFNKRTNRNGNMLLELASEKSLCIVNTTFEKREGKRWTYEGPKGDRHLIDYILVNSKWINSVRNAEAYSSFASVGSDHRIITMVVQLSLRVTKPPTSKKSYDWKLLRNDQDLQSSFKIELRNRFNQLYVEDASSTDQYNAFIEANKDAAVATLPLVKKNKSERNSNNSRVVEARKKIENLTKRYNIHKTKGVRKLLQDAKSDLQAVYKELEEEKLKEQIGKVEDAFKASDTGNAWKIVNSITNRKTCAQGKLSGKTAEERKMQWFNHFKNLLGTPIPTDENDVTDIHPVLHNLGIDDTQFTLKEVKDAMKRVCEGKAPGEDGIMPEVIKRCDVNDIILLFANKLLMEGQKPEQFTILNIRPIPKSGNLSDTGNYRGISLTSLVAKVVNRMMLNRIRPKMDPYLRYNQNGFRPGRSTTSQVLALRRIIEGVNSNHLPSVMVFIDFTKAFDSVNQQVMFKILAAYDIPKRIVDAIILMYTDIKAKVLSPDGDTDFFEILAGIMQGDTLAPYLFVIVLDYAMRKATEGKEEELGFTLRKRRSRRVPSITMTDLDFADDIALLSNSIEQARKLLHNVEIECKKVGLSLNAKKTKSMYFNVDPEDIETQDGIKLKQAIVEETGEQDFKYLGSWICSKERDISVRKALAWQSLNKMKNIWKSNLDRKLKIQLFRATTESILLYGSATWSLTKQEEKQLDGTYTRMLRMVLNISWKDKVTNEVLYGHLEKVSWTIRKRRLALSGHIFRDKSSPAQKLITWIPTHGKRKRGRPTTTYVDTLLRDTDLENVEDLERCMEDRVVWRLISSRRFTDVDRK